MKQTIGTKQVVINQESDKSPQSGNQENTISEDYLMEIKKQNVDINFEKIWLSNMFDSLVGMGKKQLEVVYYLIQHRNKTDNYIMLTQREIANKCGVSLQTVSTTIKTLEERNILVGKSGVYQINPECIAKGSHNQRMRILRAYTENVEMKKIAKAKRR